jgi:hypothetical protein
MDCDSFTQAGGELLNHHSPGARFLWRCFFLRPAFK